MILEARISGRVASARGRAQRAEHRGGRRLHLVGAAVDLQVAELPLDHQDARPHLGVLESHVGERLDVQARRDLDDLRRDVAARQRAADPGAQIAHGLRLQPVQEDEGTQLGHGQPSRSAGRALR